MIPSVAPRNMNKSNKISSKIYLLLLTISRVGLLHPVSSNSHVLLYSRFYNNGPIQNTIDIQDLKAGLIVKWKLNYLDISYPAKWGLTNSYPSFVSICPANFKLSHGYIVCCISILHLNSMSPPSAGWAVCPFKCSPFRWWSGVTYLMMSKNWHYPCPSRVSQT